VRPLHVAYSVYYDSSKSAFSTCSSMIHVTLLPSLLFPFLPLCISFCMYFARVDKHLSHIITSLPRLDIVALQHLSCFYIFPRVSSISPVAVPWRIWVLTSSQTTCGLLHASSTSARAVANLCWLFFFFFFFRATRGYHWFLVAFYAQ
jgi:hypothetical protein